MDEIDGIVDVIDWGEDADTPVIAVCDLSSPEACESCQ